MQSKAHMDIIGLFLQLLRFFMELKKNWRWHNIHLTC